MSRKERPAARASMVAGRRRVLIYKLDHKPFYDSSNTPPHRSPGCRGFIGLGVYFDGTITAVARC